jgi:hypothetical protein
VHSGYMSYGSSMQLQQRPWVADVLMVTKCLPLANAVALQLAVAAAMAYNLYQVQMARAWAEVSKCNSKSRPSRTLGNTP